jgi:hypothetical protein
MPSENEHILSPGEFSPEPPSPLVNSTALEPIYGDKTADQGDEVRFSVELTRIDRLDDTFSLDIRRLKGNLRSYKFLYDTLKASVIFSRALPELTDILFLDAAISRLNLEKHESNYELLVFVV